MVEIGVDILRKGRKVLVYWYMLMHVHIAVRGCKPCIVQMGEGAYKIVLHKNILTKNMTLNGISFNLKYIPTPPMYLYMYIYGNTWQSCVASYHPTD